MDVKDAKMLEAETLKSQWFKNNGGLKFDIIDMPQEVQEEAVMDIEILDLLGEGSQNILAVGNRLHISPRIGPQMGSYGTVMTIENEILEALSNEDLGFWIDGEVRKLGRISNVNGNEYLIVARNSNSPLMIVLTN